MSPAPDRARVDLWEVALDALPVTDATFNGALGMLSSRERERAGRLRRPADRRHAVLRWALLRHLLGGYLGEPGASVALITSPAGKPSLARDSALQFNLSHRGGLVLYAFTWGRPVGVDLEQARPVAEADEIVASLCAPEEARRYAALPARLRPHAFLHLWTCKEAYVKGTGEGLALGLDRFVVGGSDDRARVRRLDGSPLGRDDWHLCGLWVDAAHRGAVACRGAPPELLRRRVTHWPTRERVVRPR